MRGSVFASMLAIVALLPAGPAAARSALVLPYPPSIGSIPAATYDDDGNRVGDAELSYFQDGDGRLRLRAVTSVANGARNLIEAELAEIGDGSGLRVLWERSQSHDESGEPLVVVEVDHERGEARCKAPDGKAELEVLDLPEDDRVANTVMSLLFLPLVRGETKSVRYQSFLCRGGARFMDFIALAGDRATRPGGRDVVEIDFGPDLGFVVSRLAAMIVPKLRFWFDAAQHGDYLAHRMPLYGGGPEVVVMRDGLSPRALPR